MEVGVVDLGPMGVRIVRRLLAGGHRCVVWDRSSRVVAELAAEKAYGAASLSDVAVDLDTPRAICLTVPASAIDATLAELLPHLDADDIIVNCTDVNHLDDARRAAQLAARHIHYLDVGITGGIAYPDRGRCLTIGGDAGAVRHMEPVFAELAAGSGFLHCGASGAGHFVNMIHRGIEHCMIAVYSEAFSVLHAAHVGGHALELADIAGTWQHGSLVASPLLELTARALANDASLRTAATPSQPTTGPWLAIKAAVEEDVPIPVFASAVYASEGRKEFSNRLVAAVQRERTNPRQAAGSA
jgi:6-phosphogluconate dehydrogenase